MMAKQLPLVVVLGATACGKSKLAIDIARRFGGEIISADSMQVYHGLDIVTNKVTEEEQSLAKHHMIDFVNPLNRYSVVDFKHQSLDIITNLLSRNILPIVVGGTNYYIESLLWKGFLIDNNETSKSDKAKRKSTDSTLIDTETKLMGQMSEECFHTEDDLTSVEKFFKKPIFMDGFRDIPSAKLWNILEQVDHEAAHIYHLNDKRRIIRMLQVYQAKGKSYTDLLKEVNKSQQAEKTSLGGPLRYNPTCVIWLDYNIEKLDKICDERVDKMLEKGLLSELEDFHKHFNKDRLERQVTDEPDYQKGIFQTIGFKEFHDYLILDSKQRDTEEAKQILTKSIEQMKLSTRRYARSQLKWIRRRFLLQDTRDLPPVFKLTTCFEDEHWDHRVSGPALRIIDLMIKGDKLDDELSAYKQEPVDNTIVNNPATYYCEPCDRTFIGTFYIDTHMVSKNHRRKLDQFNRKRLKLETAS